MARVGIKPPKTFLWARSWADWGKKSDLITGAVVVFSRQGGGHVGVLEKYEGGTMWVRGFNQSDTVNVARRPKDKSFLAARWPSGWDFPKKDLVASISNAVNTGKEA